MTVTVEKSPWPADYEDTENTPPWSYSGTAFKNWVWEVLLNLGKAGRYPRNVNEAVEVAEAAKYTVTVKR